MLQNSSGVKELDILDGKGEKVVLDISLIPSVQELKLHNCEIFASRPIIFENCTFLGLADVKIYDSLRGGIFLYSSRI